MTRDDIIHLIQTDSWMMEILTATKSIDLPDWWIGAGFIRSKVWDTLHEYTERTAIPDIDVIYFDPHDFTDIEASQDSTAREIEYEKKLFRILPTVQWSVTNQARMHTFHQDEQYHSSTEALSKWVETATCIGATLDSDNRVILTTPHGIDDLVQLIVRPTIGTDLEQFYKRIENKKWLTKWPKLTVLTD